MTGGRYSVLSPRRELLLLLRYGLAGALNTLIGFAVILLAMSVLGMPPAIANATGFVVGYPLGYLLHRSFTFRSRVPHGKGFTRWLAVMGIGYGANLAVLTGLIALGLNQVPAQALAVASYVAITFVLGRLFVFAAQNEKGEA